MKFYYSKILNILLAPIRSHRLAFVFLSVALLLPDLATEINLNWICNNPVFFIHRLLMCFGISYLLLIPVLLVSQFSSWAGNILLFAIHVIIFALAFTDIFLFKLFGIHINTYMLQLVNETNSQETSEFLQVYILTRHFLKASVALVVFVATEIGLAYLLRHHIIPSISDAYLPVANRCKHLLSILISLFVLGSVGFLIYVGPSCFSPNWKQNVLDDKAWDTGIAWSFVFKSYQSIVQFIDERDSFDRCAKSQENLSATIGSSSVPNIIVVIGESFNRHHSSLYGYDHPTNPKLQQANNLYVFDDVITPVNLTSASFQQFLTVTNYEDKTDWCDVPLFPAIFKRAGYNVAFFSNQYVKEIDMSPFDASAGFFNHPSIEPLLFTHRNSHKFDYDEDLIEDFQEQRPVVESDSNNLIFFHLKGQHVDPAYRFPKGRERLHPSDYHRPELTTEQLQAVVNYDNATAYNDSIVNEIIKFYHDKDAAILYFADHGDEAYDYRPHIGRSLDLNEIGAPGLHCQLDIPFLIVLTDSCRAVHPELEKRIARSTHRPFMLDDLPHLLFDIADIRTPWYQPSRSLINDQYNIDRQRIIDNGYSTTSPIDYDKVCKAYGEWKIGFNKTSNDK